MLFLGDVNIDKIQNMTIKVASTVNIECQTANITATNVNIKGDTAITGKLNVTGNIVSQAEVSANGGSVNLGTHTHKYNPGPGDPTPSQPGEG